MRCLVLLVLFSTFPFRVYHLQASDSLAIMLVQWQQSEAQTLFCYALQKEQYTAELNQLEQLLCRSAASGIPDLRSHLMWQHARDQLSKECKTIDRKFELELTRRRYKKGLELIRLLYEKILALDHHFSSIQVQQQIAAISNPNNYAAFREARQQLSETQRKDHALALPAILQSNPYLSTTFSLISSVLSSDHQGKREEKLTGISCILDFTARMHSELSTIYYETEFLKQSNADLRAACALLFTDYMKVIGYSTSLEECRRTDDWEEVYDGIETLFKSLQAAIESGQTSELSVLYRQVTDLEFSVDRLVNFIDRYNAFITQGEKYYQKFLVIAETYPNTDECAEAFPTEFTQLKEDIHQSISKFNEAYNISALRGSKLKDLLYGYDE